MPSDCPRFGKWIGGCRFEPRYDEPPVREMTNSELRHHFPVDVTKLAESIGGQIYVRDVCVRCGRTVERAS